MWICFSIIGPYYTVKIFSINCRIIFFLLFLVQRMEPDWIRVRPIWNRWNRFQYQHIYQNRGFGQELKGYMQEYFALRSWCYRWLYVLVLNGTHIPLGQGTRSYIEAPISGNQFEAEFECYGESVDPWPRLHFPVWIMPSYLYGFIFYLSESERRGIGESNNSCCTFSLF